jgi:hypothetical protein
MTQPLPPQDIACLRMLAGAHFREVTLPSGRTLSAEEAAARLAEAVRAKYADQGSEDIRGSHGSDQQEGGTNR